MKKIIKYIVTVLIIIALVGCTKIEPENNDKIEQLEKQVQQLELQLGNAGIQTGTYQPFEFEFEKEIKTSNFKSENEYEAFLKDFASGDSGGYFGGSMNLRTQIDVEMMEDVVMDKAVSAPSITMDESGLDYSETNVQVKGVDEADIIKTDGNYIYTVTNKILYIIKAYPGKEAKIVSTIKFENNPSSIFIKDNQLAVFGNFYDTNYFNKMNIRPRYGMSYFNIYDISDKNSPDLIKEYKFEGNYFRARMTGSYIYFITSTRPEYRVGHLMPIIIEDDIASKMPVEDIYYYDIPYRNPMFINIHAINIEDPSDEINSKAVAVEGSQNMYMSENNIYITYTQYINEYDLQKKILMDLLEDKLTDFDNKLIEKIKKTDNDILSKWEKESKIFQIYQDYMNYMDSKEREKLEEKTEEMLEKALEEYEFFEFTVINKINVDDDDITPIANGKVPGHTINQFSMDEHDGVLRIGTTVNARWSRFEKQRTESMNNIYTLDHDLDIMDELKGLAEGEQIYSTRFIGDRLYMVTFRQVDPFFVIDLSNPNNIKEMGELKIPGFSRYLHPYDEDTIIGIGQDATERGRTTGLKISLFDVSDVNNPKEIAKYVGDDKYAQSNALYEHKAFLFSKEKNLLVIPVYNYDYQDSSNNYNGAFVFKITKDEIDIRGLIDHSKSITSKYWYSPSVERSLYIEELLYTKSPNLLRINKLDTLEGIKDIELKEVGGKIPVY